MVEPISAILLSGLTAIGGLMSKAEKSSSLPEGQAARRAFWNGVLEGFSGPLMLGYRTTCVLPHVTADGKREFVQGLGVGLDEGFSSYGLPQAMTSAAIETALKHGIEMVNVHVRELDSEGKLRDVIRCSARQRSNDGSEQP